MDWQIEYYTDNMGIEPVKQFISAQPLDAQVTIFHVIGLLEDVALNIRYPYVYKIGKTGIRN